VRVVELTAEQTHALRRAVLRRADPEASVVFECDHDPATFHLGVVDDGVVIATSTWVPAPPSAQLRGMAVEPSRQGEGLATGLLEAAYERLRALGVEQLWAHARDTALSFYTRAGFTVVGEGFVTPDTGLAHHLVTLSLDLEK
jgi:phosphoribosylformimino-5-aminoimidazole carboxamide ribotide isomerase